MLGNGATLRGVAGISGGLCLLLLVSEARGPLGVGGVIGGSVEVAAPDFTSVGSRSLWPDAFLGGGAEMSHLTLANVMGNLGHVPGAPAVAGDYGIHGDSNVSPEALTQVVQRYCQVCHNDQLRTGDLSLIGFEVAEAVEQWEMTERIIHKLQAGMMPPPGIPRPAGDTLALLVATLEEIVDSAAERPAPGTRPFQRLNRAEYERVIEDLLGLEVEAGSWLPLDTYLANFDNQADAQVLSPTLLDAYLNAAAGVSRIAIGDPDATATSRTYRSSVYVSQHAWDHVEGAPYGTRGGIVVTHDFPADGWYVLELEFRSGRASRFEDVDVSINGEQVALLHYDYALRGGATNFLDRSDIPLKTEPVFVQAGQHQVSAAFIRNMDGPYEDLIRPHRWALAGTSPGGYGNTALPHIQELIIAGPRDPTGISETPSRERIFSCRPASSEGEEPCAEEIISNLATRAYRRPVTGGEVEGLMGLYRSEATQSGFEQGIGLALEAILSSPHFLFRVEREPANMAEGEVFRLNDFDLASRLSFFLWGRLPDGELMEAAERGSLSNPEVLEAQVKRMLADPRAEALATRFAAQWLRLQDLHKVHPDGFWYPDFDENLKDLMRRETELFFHQMVQEDRSFLELFTADYTFVNERLAEHYGIPGVAGTDFTKVAYSNGERAGVLGHGSVLLLTSMGNRTSPVLRGKWVMEVLLGTPPPPPPPGIPELEETEGTSEGRLLTTRERLEIHRANPTCNACHQFMDPIGVALEGFDVTGRVRLRDQGALVDTKGDFYDGSRISGLRDLVDTLLERPEPLVRTFAENLLTYAIGRPVDYFDKPTIRAISNEAARNDYRMSAFIMGVVNSPPFLMKMADGLSAEIDDRGR